MSDRSESPDIEVIKEVKPKVRTRTVEAEAVGSAHCGHSAEDGSTPTAGIVVGNARSISSHEFYSRSTAKPAYRQRVIGHDGAQPHQPRYSFFPQRSLAQPRVGMATAVVRPTRSQVVLPERTPVRPVGGTAVEGSAAPRLLIVQNGRLGAIDLAPSTVPCDVQVATSANGGQRVEQRQMRAAGISVRVPSAGESAGEYTVRLTPVSRGAGPPTTTVHRQPARGTEFIRLRANGTNGVHLLSDDGGGKSASAGTRVQPQQLTVVTSAPNLQSAMSFNRARNVTAVYPSGRQQVLERRPRILAPMAVASQQQPARLTVRKSSTPQQRAVSLRQEATASPLTPPAVQQRVAARGPLPRINLNLPTLPQAYYARSADWTAQDEPDEEYRGRFKCDWCDKLCPTNVSLSVHMAAHFLDEPVRTNLNRPEEEVDEVMLYDQCRCRHCFAIFASPYRLQEHELHVHSRAPLSHANACHMCERHYPGVDELTAHLQQTHSAPEAPYSCKVCRFRSSLFADLWHHFVEEHGHTLLVMCPLCLYMWDARTTGANRLNNNRRSTIASAAEFVDHMKMHIARQGDRLKCGRCRLFFARDADFSRHVKTQHSSSKADLVAIKCNGAWPVSLAAAAASRPSRRLLRPATRPVTVHDAQCIECRQPMSADRHYRPRLSSCLVCSFGTACKQAYEQHMLDHARGLEALPTFARRRARPLPNAGRCRCGFVSQYGNQLATHLATCAESDGAASFWTARSPPPAVGVRRTSAVPRRLARALHLAPLPAVVCQSPAEDHADELDDEDMLKAKMREILERPTGARGEPAEMRPPSLLHSIGERQSLKRQASAAATPVSTPKRRRLNDDDDDADGGEQADEGSSSSRAVTPSQPRIGRSAGLRGGDGTARAEPAVDPFVKRRATADALGVRYKHFRDRRRLIDARLHETAAVRKTVAVRTAELEKSVVALVVPGVLERLVEAAVADADAIDYDDFLLQLGIANDGAAPTPSPTPSPAAACSDAADGGDGLLSRLEAHLGIASS